MHGLCGLALGLPAGRFSHMKKFGVEVTRGRDGNGLHNLTNITAMVGAMCNDVEEHFFPGHRAGVAICEAERDRFAKLGLCERSDVALKPGISFGNGELKLAEFRCCFRIRSLVSMRLTKQMSSKDSINDIDVVERPSRRVDRASMLLGRDLSYRVKQIVVRPGLLCEE